MDFRTITYSGLPTVTILSEGFGSVVVFLAPCLMQFSVCLFFFLFFLCTVQYFTCLSPQRVDLCHSVLPLLIFALLFCVAFTILLLDIKFLSMVCMLHVSVVSSVMDIIYDIVE